MVYITLKDNIHLKIDCDRLIINEISEHFSYFVDGFKFTPQYKSGSWDGKIKFLKGDVLAFGLLFDLIKFLKKKGYKTVVADEVKQLFNLSSNKWNLDNLNLIPRDYQTESINKMKQFSRGIIESCTGSGKSLVIGYVLNNLLQFEGIKKVLIVVPTTSLILQFKDDLMSYGINEDLIGQLYAEKKEYDKSIVISTWQSLVYDYVNKRNGEIKKLHSVLRKKLSVKERDKNTSRLELLLSDDYRQMTKDKTQVILDFLNSVDCVFIDETHTVKAQQLQGLLQKLDHVNWRFGCTGTLPDSKIDLMGVKSYIGEVIHNVTVKDLTDRGYLNKCIVEVNKINYHNDFVGTLNEVKDNVFANKFRLLLIKQWLSDIGNDNSLILVGKIEKEGKLLERELQEYFPDKQIKFIHGGISTKIREEWRQKCINQDNVIIIAVYALFQAGINIPNLSHIIFASSYKAKIRTLQSIGRSLRKIQNKGTSTVIDIVDMNNKFLSKHGNERMKFYKKEGFEIEINKFKEY